MTKIRTRFAPSPTGFMHIGGVRTAIYGWLTARHAGGQFLLRIEDTDQGRFTEGAVKSLISSLEWLGLDYDEGPSKEELAAIESDWTGAPDVGGPVGPYVQSLRGARYQEIAQTLIESGHAFRCDCTKEMLEAEREEQQARKETPGYGGRCRNRNVPPGEHTVVRFRMPEDARVVMNDLIRGTVTWESIPLRDPIILKADGLPTYHLAVVVDDHDMEISHVTRGEEWISSAPLHILLYQALGWKSPAFAHLPTILGDDGKKLSKRHGAASVDTLKEQGYLPEAVFNFLTFIGWNPGSGEEREIFSRDELIRLFRLEQVKSSGAVFNYEKLDWMNGVYVREMPLEPFLDYLGRGFSAVGLNYDEESLRGVAPLLRDRIRKFSDIPDQAGFLFREVIERDLNEMLNNKVDASLAQQILKETHAAFEKVETFDHTRLHQAANDLPKKLGLKAGQVFIPIRIATTGKKNTPPLFESLELLGRERTLRRLMEACGELEQLK